MDTAGVESPATGSSAGDDARAESSLSGRIREFAGRRLVRIALAACFLVVAVIVLHDKVPSVSTVLTALRRANWWLVTAAMTLQVASIALQIRQQRRLLGAFGVSVPLPRVRAITYSSTAISMSMPVGGALSAGYTYRQYRANGATPATAATVLLLSGVASVIALAALTLAGIGAPWLLHVLKLHRQLWWQLLALAVGVGVIVEVLAMALGWSGRRKAHRAPRTHLRPFVTRHPKLGSILGQLSLTGHQASHLRRHHWRLVLLTSAGNWALDAASLYASCRALGVHISVLHLGAVYLGVQLVRQIPITPGGIGVIEAALLAGLVAAHAAKGPAAAAVVIYRLFAAWLVVPIGFVMLAFLRNARPAGQDWEEPSVDRPVGTVATEQPDGSAHQTGPD